MPEQTYTQDELDTMHANLRQLDPNREGVTMDKLRPFYPAAPWNWIRPALMTLVDAGRATHKLRPAPNGKVSYEFFTWV